MNPLHDSEHVVGRITVRKTWDRRYKLVHPPPEPTGIEWGDVIGAFSLVFLFVAAFILWPYL
jgi:hypothetical protein